MTARLLAGCAALVAAAAVSAPPAAPAAESVGLSVRCVLASNTGQDFDPRLGTTMHARFNRMFRYTSYSLLKEKQEQVSLGSKLGFDVPGGRYLMVIPKEFKKDGSIIVRVVLLDGARPIVNTAISLHNHGIFLVAGPQHSEGTLILSIGANLPDPPATE